MPIAPSSSAELIDLLRKSGVVTADKLAGLAELGLPPEPQKAAAILVARGTITRFQAQQLLAGRHKGFRLGAYAILDLLGRGGMGAVYLGEHLELHRKVAIKILVPGKDDDQKLAVERFQREARAVAALDHPNIVRIFDVSRHGETPYLVMEYVEGETLQQILDRDGSVPYTAATEYVAQAAAGLQHAYEKGFVHRDIKPANMIRDKSGVVKILDMGLARSSAASDKLTEQLDKGAVVGTADFIAPEQGLNQPNVDIRADIYSLGAAFFALVIGKPPFEGNTTQKLLQHQLKNAPTMASLDTTLPKGLSAVVAKMLAKKPSDRFQTPGDVIAALAPWMGNSSRIVAGLSRTNLGQSAELQTALAEIGRSGSSRRLSSAATRQQTQADNNVEDSGEVDASNAAQETGAVTGAVTTREPNRKKKPSPVVTSGKRWVLIAGLGVAMLAAGAIAGWLAFGPSQKAAETTNSDTRPRSDQEKPKPDDTKKDPLVIPKVEPKLETPAGEKVAFHADFAEQKPFTVRSGLRPDANDAKKSTFRLVSQSGAEPPKDWQARCWNAASEMEFFSDDLDGKPTLGIRNVKAPASAMLFTPTFECPSGSCRLKFEYQAAVHEKRFTVKFKTNDNRGAWVIATPAVTGDVWRSEDLIVDMKGATGGLFEFHQTDEKPDAALRIRSLVITELKASKSIPVQPEKVVFKLDAADVKPFKNTREGFQKTDGDDSPPIKGVYFGAWKKDTINAWECGTIDGVKAIGFTNLNEVNSAQIGIELESATGLGLKFEPGQLIRLRVTYKTAEKGRGAMYFQSMIDYKVPARVELPNSNAEWKTVELFITREDQPLRCVIDTLENGAGNTFYVRSATIITGGKRVSPVATPPKEKPADDFANWTEATTIYSLDIAKIAAFRIQKEQFTRLAGEAETLPAGIGCQCWREKAVSDFRCEKVDDVPALSVTNLNDAMSGQFVFQLEGGMKLALQPGKTYRVKVSYATKNDAAGTMTVQVTPGYKDLAQTTLPGSEGKWKTATMSFVRPSADDKVEVRMTIDNTTVGEGNALCFRSLEIVELLPPKK